MCIVRTLNTDEFARQQIPNGKERWESEWNGRRTFLLLEATEQAIIQKIHVGIGWMPQQKESLHVQQQYGRFV